jgi:acyl carrier protein
MTKKSFEDALLTFIVESFYLEENDVQHDTPLFSSNILDSFNMIEVVTFIEKETGVAFGAMELHLDNLDSVQNMVQFVEKKRG